jgi:predicted transcriptional regulator
MILANIFQPLIDIFGPIPVFLHSIIGGSWGWSIIELTIVVRALLLPLAFKQMHSKQNLQQAAPQMKAIQAKYKLNHATRSSVQDAGASTEGRHDERVRGRARATRADRGRRRHGRKVELEETAENISAGLPPNAQPPPTQSRRRRRRRAQRSSLRAPSTSRRTGLRSTRPGGCPVRPLQSLLCRWQERTKSESVSDRVSERRRAAQLARHYRNQENLTIAEIAQRLGRAEATVKAYLYDPTDANKGPSREREAEAGGRELRTQVLAVTLRGEISNPAGWFLCLGGLSSTSGEFGVLMLDRVAERRRAAQLARHYRDQEGLSIAEIARRLGRAEATIKAYLYDPTGDKARAVKACYRGLCRGCGAPTAPRNGKGDAYAYCNCAARRPVVSPAQPGRTRRDVLGSNDLPGSER